MKDSHLLHIGFLTPEYPHKMVNYSAGIGTSLKNLIDSLVNLGCRVSVFIYNQPHFDFIEEGNLTLHLLQNTPSGSFSWYQNRKRINRYIEYFIATEKIKLLEVPDWTGISSFMSFSCPVVVRLHGSDGFFCFLEQRKQKLKNRLLEKLALKKCDALISPNKFTLETTQRVFEIDAFKRFSIINLGIDLSTFGTPDYTGYVPKTVYYIGTIIRKKGVFYLPLIFEEILKIDPEVQFFLIGNDSPDVFTGSDSTWHLLENEFASDVFSKVNYLGKIDYSEVAAELKKANVCLFPSNAETTGMVTLEAMAMGKAVVTSNEEWSKEIIDHEKNGFRVNPSDPKKFAKVVCSILANPQLIKDLGKMARFKIELEFDANVTAKKNLEFYKEVIGS